MTGEAAMSRQIFASALALLAFVLVTALPGVARAELKFCNHTYEDVNLAIGFSAPDTKEWTSEGWFTVKPNECYAPPPLSGNLKARYYYYYADSEAGKWGGNYIFCVQDKKFDITGTNVCKSRGYEPQGFREIDVGEDMSKVIDLDAPQ
jgi:uncharacterized membrane protein